jgi:hypothetical protein
MSNERVSHLDKVQKLVDEIYNDSPNNIVLLAVELDEKGHPLGRMQKVRSTPGCSLGAVSMIEEAIKEVKADCFNKINMAGELSDKLADLFKKLGVDDISEMDETLSKVTDPEIKRQLRDAIKRLKDQF